MIQYLRQKGDDKVFAIINGGAYYVDYNYAKANNVFPQVQEVTYRIDTKYPLSGPVASAPKEQQQPAPVVPPTQPSNPPPQQPPQQPPPQNSQPKEDLALSKSGQYFIDSNNDVYEASTNRKLSYQEFKDLGLNANFLPRKEVSSQQPGNPPSQPDQPQSITGVPELDGLLDRMYKMLEDNIAAGKTINPNIELEPGVVSQFVTQAEAEFEPYYSSQIKIIKDDVVKSLDYLGKQYQLGKEASEEKFKETLAGSRENRAGTGTIFSGARAKEEQGYATAQSRNLELSALAAEDAARNTFSTAEKTIGSRNLAGLTSPSFTAYSASSEGEGRYSPGRSLSFSGTGDVTGSLERERTTAVYGRRNELEEAERKRRALNFYNV